MIENLQNKDDNYIKIFLRIMPKLKNVQNSENYLTINENKNYLSMSLSPENESKFYFEKIFNENESQSSIFKIIGRPLCENILEGINSSFISYGKKSTGKTYTILGKTIQEIQKEVSINGNETDGLFYRYLNNKGIFNFCLEYIFNNIYMNEKENNFDFNIELSYIEIFDNCIFDYFNLLNFDKNNQLNLDNLFNTNDSSNLNFTKLNISSPDEAFVLLGNAEKIRKHILKEINLIEESGNIMIKIFVEKVNKKINQMFKSELNFVEISSNFNSEKNKYNLSVNKSLEIFSYIINQLSDHVKRENIIYENSILTNALKESLGGNSKTSVLINISPYSKNIIDSFQSISFASKMKEIRNYPKINYIYPDNIVFSKYIEIVDKTERLKSEKNYLLNYLGNVNVNNIEKNIENVSKKLPQNQNKKEKQESLKNLSDKINEMNINIEKIENDIKIMKKEQKINNDKNNKINISLFIKNNEIDVKKNYINSEIYKKKEKEDLINQYTKENINLDSEILKQELEIKEQKMEKEEENCKLNKEISIINLQKENKDIIINNLKGINNNLRDENEHKNKIKTQLEKISEELDNEKKEKIHKINDIKNEHDKKLNKSKQIKQEITDKNSQFNNFQKNLIQYNEYENITINYFKKFYDENNKKEIQNNNKFFGIQRYIPEKEKELKQLCKELDNINIKKIQYLEEQEKIKQEISIKGQNCKKLEQENTIFNNQISNLNNKISILTKNINFTTMNQDLKVENEAFQDKNVELNNSIISYEIQNDNNHEVKDILLFKNNFNVNLDDKNKEQLLENKKKLLEQEQNENIVLKEKKNLINNEIYKFKINQLKFGNNQDKNHSQYNLVKIEENIEKINEKEEILSNYQNYINTNYNLLKNYLRENNSNSKEEKKELPIKHFKNVFSKFIEKANQIDTEFELIKKEFKEREEEYRRTNKEVVNESLKNFPLLKNYEEIFNNKDENNNSVSNITNRSENNTKRITMIDNKILSDVKNLSIYNGIYSKKRKLNDYLNSIPQEESKSNEKKNLPLFGTQSENKNDNIFINKNNKNKEVSLINSTKEKEIKINNQKKENNLKTQIAINKKRKVKCLYKSPDKISYFSKKDPKCSSSNNYNYNSNSKIFPNFRKN